MLPAKGTQLSEIFSAEDISTPVSDLHPVELDIDVIVYDAQIDPHTRALRVLCWVAAGETFKSGRWLLARCQKGFEPAGLQDPQRLEDAWPFIMGIHAVQHVTHIHPIRVVADCDGMDCTFVPAPNPPQREAQAARLLYEGRLMPVEIERRVLEGNGLWRYFGRNAGERYELEVKGAAPWAGHLGTWKTEGHGVEKLVSSKRVIVAYENLRLSTSTLATEHSPYGSPVIAAKVLNVLPWA